MLLLAPAAAEPDWLVSVDWVDVLPVVLLDVLPEAALGVLLDVEPPGHGQVAADDPPLAAGALELVPLEVVLPEVEPLALADGVDDVLPLVDGAVPPDALEVVPELGVDEPDALPEPVDWLVCAPCVIVEDGLVVVAFWLALAAPVDTL